MLELFLTAVIVGQREIAPGVIFTEYLTVQNNRYEIVSVVENEMDDLD